MGMMKPGEVHSRRCAPARPPRSGASPPIKRTFARLTRATPSRGTPPTLGTPMSEANNCVSADMSDEWRGRARRELDRRLIRHLDVICRGGPGRDALRISSPPFGPRDPSPIAWGRSGDAWRSPPVRAGLRTARGAAAASTIDAGASAFAADVKPAQVNAGSVISSSVALAFGSDRFDTTSSHLYALG